MALFRVLCPNCRNFTSLFSYFHISTEVNDGHAYHVTLASNHHTASRGLAVLLRLEATVFTIHNTSLYRRPRPTLSARTSGQSMTTPARCVPEAYTI